MPVLRGTTLKGARLRTTPQIRKPRCPKVGANKPEKIRDGLGISGYFERLHGKHLQGAKPESWLHAQMR
jgi:hypothetical protein